MEFTSATKAREIVREYIKAQTMASRKNAEKKLADIEQVIVMDASNGKRQTEMICDKNDDIAFDYVCEILSQNGYVLTVSRESYTIIIKW